MNIKYLASAGVAIVIAAVAVAIFAVGGGNAKATQSQAAARTAISIRSTSLRPSGWAVSPISTGVASARPVRNSARPSERWRGYRMSRWPNAQWRAGRSA